MNALYAAFLTAGAQLSKMFAGFVLLKMIAYYLGASGLGSLGHFMSLVSIISMLAGGGITSGIIKYVSEYKFKTRKLVNFINTSVIYALVSSSAIFFVGVIFSKSISTFIFGSEKSFWIIILLALSQLGFAFTNLVTGVSNGLGNTKVYAVVQIVGNSIGLPLAYILLQAYQIEGAALAILAIVFVQVFPAYIFFRKGRGIKSLFRIKTGRADYCKLIRFTSMLAASVIAFPVIEILVRQQLIKDAGYVYAGIWQGAVKLSGAYISFFGVFLAYYYMPLISFETDKTKITRNVFRVLIVVMGIFFFGAVVLFTFRGFFIPLLLSKDFKLLENFIGYQLIGDFFRVASHVIGFVAVAKAATKTYILAEIFQSLAFYTFVLTLRLYFPTLNGVFIGYMLTYILYFILSLVVFIWWIRNEQKTQ